MTVEGTPSHRVVTRRYRFKIAYEVKRQTIFVVGIYRFQNRSVEAHHRYTAESAGVRTEYCQQLRPAPPAALKRELKRVAREDGTSLNQLIVTAVAEKLSALRTADFFEERRARHHAPQTAEVPRDGDRV